MKKSIFLLFLPLIVFIFSDPVYDAGIIEINETKWKNVTVITADDLENMKLTSLSEALNHVAGINFSIGSKGENSIFIRGLDKSRIKILINGIPVNDAFYDTSDLDMIPVDGVEKIEIYKGISSVAFSGNNIAGVINIVMKKENPFFVKIERDTFNGEKLGTGFELSLNKVYINFNYSFRHSPYFRLSSDFEEEENQGPGIRNNSFFSSNNISICSGIRFNRFNHIQFNYMSIDNIKDLPYHVGITKSNPTRIFREPRYWRFSEWRQNIYAVNFVLFISPLLKVGLDAGLIKIHNELQMYLDKDFLNIGQTDIFNDSVSSIKLDLQGIYFLTFKLGYLKEAKKHEKTENIFLSGEHNVKNMFSDFENFNVILEKEIYDLTINTQFSTNKFVYEDRIFSDINYYFKADYRLWRYFHVQFQYGFKTNFPNLKQLSDAISDDLVPEKSKEICFNLIYSSDNIKIDIGYFNNFVYDLIRRDGIDLPYYNIGKSIISGFEMSFKYDLGFLFIVTNIDRIRAFNRSGSRAEGDYISVYPFIPLLNVSNVISIPLRNVLISTEFIYRDMAYEYIDNEKTIMPSVLLMNFRFTLRLSHNIEIYSVIRNITDHNYYLEHGYPREGRQIALGMKFTL